MRSSISNSAAVKVIRDLKSITEDPIEGVYCELVDESDVFEWRIWFEGPGGSPYQGGIFEAAMAFPQDYPMSPPSLRVISEFWHPNVYKDGRVCISILHTPGNDPTSGELPEERWYPTQTVSTIMLSFQSMLSDPNISSPANIDASVQWRDHRADFCAKTKALVETANKMKPAHVKIPHPDTDPEEKARLQEKMKKMNELDTFSLHDGELDSYELPTDDSQDGSEDEDDTDAFDAGIKENEPCPKCKGTIAKQKSFYQCTNCQAIRLSKQILCGKKCYVFDCGEILPTGTCKQPIFAENGWKCSKNTHKDDPNGEDNFLAAL